MEQWVPLNRVQASAAWDFSKAGETFVDYNGQVNEILYSILTPFGYHAYVSAQKLRHIEKHPIARPGLEVGRDKRSQKIVAYMALSFPQLYQQILRGLKKKPIPGRFSVETLVDTGNVTPICDPRVKNATFAEIVQWVWEKYYAHLEEGAKVGAGA